MTKSVHGIAFIKEQLFSLKMDQGKSLEDNLKVFERLVTDLTNAEESLSDHTHAVLLLNSLPENYKDVMNAIKYGRESIFSGRCNLNTSN